MDLALENRIDTDLEQLTLVDATPLEDDLLDPILADIARTPGIHPPPRWIAQMAGQGDAIRERAVARLVERGIFESDFEAEGALVLSRPVARSRRYTVEGQTMEDVRLRIMRVLFSQEIPDPRDIVIISLADACGIFGHILSDEELNEVRERITLIRQMDLIGLSVAEALRELEPAAPVPPPRREIPHAPGLPLIGNAIGMVSNLPAFLLRQYRSLGPVFRIRALNRRFIVLMGPEANDFAVRANKYFRAFETWVDFNKAIGAMRILVSMDGPEHIRMRKELANGHSHKMMAGREAEAIDIARQDIAEWPQDRPLPALHLCRRIILEQLSRLALSTSTREYFDDIEITNEALLKTYLNRQRPKLLLHWPRTRRARQRSAELTRQVLADHAPENRGNKAPDYIDDLLKLHRKDPQFLTEVELAALVLSPLGAGLDTAANICAFMIYELLKHPDLRQQLTAEADTLFDRETFSLRELHQLDITHRVVMETLRLYPLTPVVPRFVCNAFEFGGYTIPSGEQVLVASAMPHFMAEYFPDPQRFDIERYTTERAEHRQPGVYAPFGLGAHRCPGSNLAEALIAVNMLTIFHETELALDPPDYRLKVKTSPTCHPARSFRVRLVRRRT